MPAYNCLYLPIRLPEMPITAYGAYLAIRVAHHRPYRFLDRYLCLSVAKLLFHGFSSTALLRFENSHRFPNPNRFREARSNQRHLLIS